MQPSSKSPQTDEAQPKAGDRLKTLVSEYGGLALAIYLSTSVMVYGGTAAALSMGLEIDAVAGTAGTLGAGWAVAKLTQPFRIAFTLLLTPLVARLLRRERRQVAVSPTDTP